jgi:hypothetical protein
MLIGVPPFHSHILVFFLEPLDRLLTCDALLLYMPLAAFDFLSRVG